MKTLRAHGFSQRPRFEQVVGYLERNEPLPLDQPDRKATTFITSHFYLDDFVQSSEDPNPQPLQHTPLRAIPEEGFRTPDEAWPGCAKAEETAVCAARPTDLVGAGAAGLAAVQAFRSQLPQDAAEAVAAEEGEVAVAAEGVGGAFGPGRRSSSPRTHGGRVAGAMAATP